MRFTSIVAFLAASIAGIVLVGAAGAASAPALRVLAVTGPTHLSPRQSEVQQVIVEGDGGTFRLSSGELTTQQIPFDASPQVVQVALEDAIGVGSVSVTGGSGGSAASPYLIEFGGSFADRDVPQLGAAFDELGGAHSFVRVSTTIPGGNGTGEIVAAPANVGGASSSGTVTLHVGPLPSGIVTSGPASGNGWVCRGGAGASGVSCTTTQSFRAIHATPYEIAVPIEIEAGAPAEASVEVQISGGGSKGPGAYRVPIVVSDEPAPYGVAAAFGGATEADGSPSTQAGGHPFAFSAYIFFNTRRLATGGIEPLVPVGDSKEVIIDMPPGLVANPLVGKRCPQSQLAPPESEAANPGPLCGEDSTIGNLDPIVYQLNESAKASARLYNDVPPRGVAAQFTTTVGGLLQSVIAGVDSEGFGTSLAVPNNGNSEKLFGIFTAFEGVRAAGGGRALLTNPTDCVGSALMPPSLTARVSSYQEPDSSGSVALPQPAVTGCDKLHFAPSFTVAPSTAVGSSPAGATAELRAPQAGLVEAEQLAPPPLRKAVVSFPEGLTLNPASADGLQGCSEAQIGYKGNFFAMPTPIRFDETQPACPDGSKLGSAEVETPLIDHPLLGEVFLADQGENPFGSLLAVYLVIDDPLSGVLVKLAGEVRVDPATGRLTAIFDHNPQLPFEGLSLSLRGGGPRSLFATSEVCGSFPTEGEWTPWSAPESGPPARTASPFAVTGNCAVSPGARPFAPSFEAGTSDPRAGAYSPLVVKVGRKDGEGEVTSIDFTLPKGLVGRLAGIPYCTGAQIAEAERNTGTQEQARQSCPAGSQVGTVDVGAGVGPAPFHARGKAYLAGPYEGAPVSIVAVVPALAGPLDLGDVVIRAPLTVDPESAQLTARSGPIPTVLGGIPLKIRSVTIDLDRPGFIVNPTDCEPMAIASSLGGGSGARSTSGFRFQAAGCKGLKFSPGLKVTLKGRTGRGGHPALTATLSDNPGEALPASAEFSLPPGELLDLKRIRGLCPAGVAVERCPSNSRLGSVQIESAFLPEPLSGALYLREPSHRLPRLVAVIASRSLSLTLNGRITDADGRLGVRLESLPDVPLSSAVLTVAGGRRGIVVNSRTLCVGKHQIRATLNAHNGARRHRRVPVRVSACR